MCMFAQCSKKQTMNLPCKWFRVTGTGNSCYCEKPNHRHINTILALNQMPIEYIKNKTFHTTVSKMLFPFVSRQQPHLAQLPQHENTRLPWRSPHLYGGVAVWAFLGVAVQPALAEDISYVVLENFSPIPLLQERPPRLTSSLVVIPKSPNSIWTGERGVSCRRAKFSDPLWQGCTTKLFDQRGTPGQIAFSNEYLGEQKQTWTVNIRPFCIF